MAKKSVKPQSSPRLYACCTKPECKTLQQMIDFLKLWGLDPKAKQDGNRWYFDVGVPAYWGQRRKERFAKGLSELPTGH